MSKCSLGQVQTKVEKKNETDEFLVFLWKRVGEMARGDVEDNGANWRNSEGAVTGCVSELRLVSVSFYYYYNLLSLWTTIYIVPYVPKHFKGVYRMKMYSDNKYTKQLVTETKPNR